MIDRLPWKRGDRPQHFVATMPEGTAEIWWHPTNNTGPEGWRVRIRCGEATYSVAANDKQHAADVATTTWPKVMLRERARVAKIDAQRQLEEQLTAAHTAGVVDVMAFGLGSSEYGRLIAINEFMRRQGWLDGTLKPLAAAVSAELYRRRTGS